jgi:hypothetical protein
VITPAVPIPSRNVSIVENIDEQPTDVIHSTNATTSNRASQELQRPTSWSPVPVAGNRVITQAVPIPSRNVSIVENIDEQPTDVIHSRDTTTSNRASQEVQRPTSWSPVPEAGNRVINQAVPIPSRNVSIVENIDEQPTDVIHSRDASMSNRASQEGQRPSSWSPVPGARNGMITQAGPISSRNASIVETIREISTDVIHSRDASMSNRASQEGQRPSSWSPVPWAGNGKITQADPISSRNVSMVETIREISTDAIHSRDVSASNVVIGETLNNRLSSVSYMNQPLLCVTTNREFLLFKYIH